MFLTIVSAGIPVPEIFCPSHAGFGGIETEERVLQGRSSPAVIWAAEAVFAVNVMIVTPRTVIERADPDHEAIPMA